MTNPDFIHVVRDPVTHVGFVSPHGDRDTVGQYNHPIRRMIRPDYELEMIPVTDGLTIIPKGIRRAHHR